METYSTAFTLGNFLNLFHKLHILIENMRLKPGIQSAVVVFRQIFEALDLSSQEALRKRCICKNSYAELSTR